MARGSCDTDRTTSGTTFKWLSIVDEYTRECVALVVDRTITSESVINTLAELRAQDLNGRWHETWKTLALVA